MAFNVNLYSFSKEHNSTAQPTGSGTEYSCVSNDDFDSLHPRIPLQIGNAANPTGYNYMKISSFGRYYWIRKWAFEKGLWVAYCDVDALASWKTQIGSTSAYVLRAAADSDPTIADQLYPTASPEISYMNLTAPWPTTGLSYSSGFYVVGVISKSATTVYYYMSASTFNSFVAAMFSDTFFNNVQTDDPQLTKANFNPIQYISSVKWFPGSLPTSGTASNIWLGYWDTGISARTGVTPYGTYSDNYTAPRHPQAATRGQYLNGAPFSEYVLDIPPFGRVNIDPSYLTVSGSFTISVVVDYITGNAVCRIYCGQGLLTNPAHSLLLQGTVGLDIQINQVLFNYVGFASSVVSTIGAALTGNIAGAISGISSTVNNNYPCVNSTGLNAGFSALLGTWRMTTKFWTLVAEDNTHRGRPLCQVRTLSGLSGYTLCTNVDFQAPATAEELEMVRTALESGYYYE